MSEEESTCEIVDTDASRPTREIILGREECCVLFKKEGMELHVLGGPRGAQVPIHVQYAIAIMHYAKHHQTEVMAYLQTNPPKAEEYGMVDFPPAATKN